MWVLLWSWLNWRLLTPLCWAMAIQSHSLPDFTAVCEMCEKAPEVIQECWMWCRSFSGGCVATLRPTVYPTGGTPACRATARETCHYGVFYEHKHEGKSMENEPVFLFLNRISWRSIQSRWARGTFCFCCFPRKWRQHAHASGLVSSCQMSNVATWRMDFKYRVFQHPCDHTI